MPPEPRTKRVVAFVDGQNLYYAARSAFGHQYPNCDVSALARVVCRTRDWRLTAVRFYTGIPEASDRPEWSRFWSGKLAVMGRRGFQMAAQ